MKNTRNLLLAILWSVILVPSAFAQVPVDEDTKKITYKEVVTVEGGVPAKMYNQCIEWINSFYPNAADVTRVRSPEDARIEIRHRIKVSNVDKNGNKTTDAGLIQYDLTLEFKDGRYRYTFTDFNVMRTSKFPLERWLDHNDPEYSAVCDIYIQQLDAQVLEIIKSLKAGMKPKVVKEDNW
jgi:hypothetical protein